MGKRLSVGIIGGGNMGTAIFCGIRRKFTVNIAEKDRIRQRYLSSTYLLRTLEVADLIKRSDIVILAVKPQNFEEILQEIQGSLTKRHLIISIAAGITTAYIEKRLGPGIRVVRTMPNLPAQIGKGVTAVTKGKFATDKDFGTADKIFQCVGKTLKVAENQIDAITAVSGSGPAYFFYFAETFIACARKLGLSPDQAIACVDGTLAGSSSLYERSGKDAAVLRKQVTSKGGTTEAALKVLMKKYDAIFLQALRAAKKRAKELSR